MSAHECNVLQLNVAGDNSRTHAILNAELFNKFHILILQDIWWGRIGGDKSGDPGDLNVYGTVSNPAWHCILPVVDQKPKGPTVAIYYRKRLAWLSGNISNHTTPSYDNVSVRFTINESPFIITNIYLHGNRAKSSLSDILDTPLDASIPAIYAGDFNLHHKNWALEGGVPPSSSGPSEDLAKWIEDNEFTILNEKNVYTRKGHGSQRDSIIDLTICNVAAYEQGITDWAALDEYRLDSDHRALCWSIAPNPIDDLFSPARPVYRFSIDNDNVEEWQQEFKKALASNPLPPEYVNPEDCQRGARSFLEAMSLATQGSMKKVRVDRNAKRPKWWDKDCHALVVSTRHSSGPGSRILRNRELRSCVRRARRKYADEVCRRAIEAKDVFALSNWGAGKRTSRVPPIKLDGRMVTEPEDQATALRSAFFPDVAPPVDAENPLGIPEHPQRPHLPITADEIANALATSSNTSAPGAHGSNYRLLKWAFHVHPEELLRLYNGCLELGHPQCLKHAIVAVIPKARKPDMSEPKAYRPISLLESLSKCLEKIIATRLLYEIGVNNLIPGTQFGGRDGTSCVDAASSLLHDVHVAWEKKKACSLLTLDIKGYFDYVNHEHLVFTLRRLGFAGVMCDWVSSFLSDRSSSLRFDDFISSSASHRPVGIPQGSPLSPVLSSVYSLPVLLSLRHLTEVSVRAYVDDFTILAVGDSVGVNATVLEHAADVAGSCLKKLGLEFDLAKSELLHMAATSKGMSANPDVHLSRADGSNWVIHGSPSIRWLGFYLDRRLNFKEHVRRCARKGLSVLARLRLLSNLCRGLSVYNARLLYKACVIPVLTYGSTLWFRDSGQTGLVALLERTQNVGLRWFLGAFRTSPIPAMEHLASIPPIKITLQKFTMNAANRLHRIAPKSEVARRMPRGWDSHDPSVPHIISATRRRTNKLAHSSPIEFLASSSQHNSEKTNKYAKPPWEPLNPWGERLVLNIDPGLLGVKRGTDSHKANIKAAIARNAELAQSDALLCYTDGSLRVTRGARRVGAAFTVQQRGVDVKIGRFGLGPRSEVFDAEMLGLLLGANAIRDIINSSPAPPLHVRFYCDNISACRAILDKRPHPAQYASVLFRKAVDDLLESHPNLHITIQWFPGHKGLTGNERADKLAHEATIIESTPLFNRTLSYSKSRVTRTCKRAWDRHWLSAKRSGHVLVTLPNPPSRKFARPEYDMSGRMEIADAVIPVREPVFSRETTTRLNQVILGHGFFGEYYERFKIPERISCPCGQSRVQTIRHVLCTCPFHIEPRMLLRKVTRSLNLKVLFGTRKGLQALLSFLAASSAFRR
jgi:ribonuclease HI